MAVSCDKAVDFPAEESGKIYINARVHIHSVIGDTEMQVIAGGNTALAHIADQLTGRNISSTADLGAAYILAIWFYQ